MKSPVVKRSIVVAGHKTSVSLEEAFWNGMKEISGLRNMTLSELVGEIDSNRQQGNLSSAIRLFVLDYFRTRAMPAAAPDAPRRAGLGLGFPFRRARRKRARSVTLQRSINESGAGRFFERGGQRPILLAARAADRRDAARDDTTPGRDCPARSATGRNTARSARGSGPPSARARTRSATACSRRACDRNSRSGWRRRRCRRGRAP